MTNFVVLLISLYQKIISQFLDMIFGKGNTCRYAPTCSIYMQDAIKKHGVFKGLLMGFQRIGRCNPYAKGGYDPVK